MDSRRTAIVTGSASGLGRAIAVALARAGWRVAMADVNELGNQETLRLVQQAGGDGQIEYLDVSSPEAWSVLRDRLQSLWQHLDLLVNNAGVGMGGEIGQLPLTDWQFILGVNLCGPIYGCHTMVEWMKRNPRGAHIVNVASLAAIVSAPGMSAYNLTKAGVLSLSETLHSELAPHNIGVTAVCPDFFETNISRSARFQTVEQRRMAERLTRDGRMTSDDVARRVLRAIEKKQLYAFVPAMADLIWRLKRFAPVVCLKIVSRYMQKKAAALAAETALVEPAAPVLATRDSSPADLQA